MRPGLLGPQEAVQTHDFHSWVRCKGVMEGWIQLGSGKASWKRWRIS